MNLRDILLFTLLALLIVYTPNMTAMKWMQNRTVYDGCREGRIDWLIPHIERADFDINAPIVKEFTPLDIACYNGQVSTVDFLLKHGASVHKIKGNVTALHIISQEKCHKGSLAIAHLLYSAGANINATTTTKDTLLHYACFDGRVELVDYFLKNGAHKNVKNDQGATPLHVTCLNKEHKVAQLIIANLLLKAGANPHAKNNNGKTPLHSACSKGHIGIIKLLLKYTADIEATCIYYYNKKKFPLTPLLTACLTKQIEIVKVLLAHKANIEATTPDKKTPLHCAVAMQSYPIAKLLLQAGANVNAETAHGATPLDIACQLNNTPIINLLVKYDASILSDEEAEKEKQAFFTDLNQTTHKSMVTQPLNIISAMKPIIKTTSIITPSRKNIVKQLQKNATPTNRVNTPKKIAQPINTHNQYSLLQPKKWPKTLNTAQKNELHDQLRQLKNWPHANETGLDIAPVKGSNGTFFRLRCGKHRVLFSIDKKQCEITIYEIALRKNIYKNMTFKLN